MRPAWCQCIALLLLASQTSSAQELVWERWGTLVPPFGVVGPPWDVLGDVNGDGVEDFVGITGGGTWGVRITTMSGRDGTVLRERQVSQTEPLHTHVRFLSGAGNMDGDGIPDYAAVMMQLNLNPPRLWVEVRSGRDESLVWSAEAGPSGWGDGYGTAMIGGLDLDGDRRPDLVVGAPWADRRGDIHAYSNRGQPLYRFRNPTDGILGVALARIGDLDRDGHEDFVASGDGVAVRSGRDGAVLVRALNPYGGDSVDGCGDLDRDGVPDFVAGGGYAGAARVFSGRTGATIHAWSETTPTQFGRSVASGGVDMDRDGIPDVAVTAHAEPIPGGGSGMQYLFSGRDGSLLFKIPAHALSGDTTNTKLMKPHPGHPFGLVLMVQYLSIPPSLSGRLRVYRGIPAGGLPFGTACRGSLDDTPRIGLRSLDARTTRIHLSGAPPGAPALLVLGLSRTQWQGTALPWSLDPLGFTGCSLFASVDLTLLATAGTTGVSRGYAAVDLSLPLSAGGAGATALHGQWLVLEQGVRWPGGVSDALRWFH